ncbi:MAG: exo-alpha-sialidase [Actinobacteria bacterium]|nr:exo-alpha-sialidase [Actinomycetota bacterium]
MKRFTQKAWLAGALVVVAAVIVSTAAAANVLVTNGSPAGYFSHNKQNEPAVAVDQAHTQYVAAGSNDEIDIEDCNPGNPTTCPFTDGVGVSGVYLSTDSGNSYTQPTYQGYTARQCNFDLPGSTCTPRPGPIGTLPRYFENNLASDGDPALAFGPQRTANGSFSYASGSRLYYVNLTSNFSSARDEQTFKGFEAVAVSRLDTQDFDDAIAGINNAWKAPVIVTKQNSALFSDKEQVWADNAQSSPFFGNVYICNVAFRGNGQGNAAPEPVLFVRSTDAGDTWSNPKQLTAATNNNQSGGRQGCAVRTNSNGVVYVYYEGFDRQANANAIFQVRSFDGGVSFERPHEVTTLTECGLPDPNTGRLSFDGVGGARTDSFPSVDIANGAPSGADASNEIVLTYCEGPTPSATTPGPNERATVKYSANGGQSFTFAGSASPAGDRPDFPAIAISPDGRDVYVTYTNFLQPWQPTTADRRDANVVVRHAEVTPDSGVIVFDIPDLERDVTGDARGSSQNGLTAEFLGDYNYAVATRDLGITVANDVRNAGDCQAVDDYRQSIADGSPTAKPAPEILCPLNFGNSDIFGGSLADPTPDPTP